MTLIILLIAIALQYYTNTGTVLPRMSWFAYYIKFMSKFLSSTAIWGNWLGVIALVIPILVIVGIVDLILCHWLYGLLDFLFSLIVLLYCLRAENLKSQLSDYFTALEEQDLVKAGAAAKAFLGKKTPDDVAGMAREVTKGIFQKAITQCFSFIFWFALFGPYGVMTYFVVFELRQFAAKDKEELKQFSHAAKQVQAVLDWVPVRLAGLSYALVGNFGAGFGYWLKTLVSGFDFENKLSWSLGLSGLQAKIDDNTNVGEPENIAAIELVNNAVVVWIVVIAIFILGYWFA